MRQRILSILSIIAFLIYPLSLSSQNSFSLSLDADSSTGDQAVMSLNVSANQNVSIQFFGTNIQNVIGVSARFEYDASQVTYEGFDAGNMLPSEQVLAEHGTNPTFVQISIVSLGGSATTNSGLIGTIRFRTRGTFSGTSIHLAQGELGKSGQVESVMLNVSIELLSGSTSSSSDFDGNGRVGFSDFWAFATKFGSSQGDGTYETKYDLDSNGSIGLSDFMLFANDFGKEVSSPDSGSSTPKMYWTDVGADKIQRANLDGSSVEDLVTTGLIRTEELALDVAGGKMYWADVGTDKIQRANLDGSSVEDLITTGLTNPDGIALDVAGGKMYWTDVGTDKIQRANLDGSSVEDLITTGLTSPESISLDVAGGKMYWTDVSTDKIQRANLDGSSVEDLITTGLTSPESISLDVAGGKMYWADVDTDKIQRANLDGSSVEDLVTTGLGDPRGIALDVGGGKMYWTDGDTDKIQRANLDGSSVEDLITTGLRNPQGIALYFFLPDLIVETPSVSNSNPNTDQSFTLSATVRNQGTDASPSTTLRYYRSTDETISTDDTQVGTDAVSSLSAFSTSEQSIDLTAPSIPGTYYYGACVESVTGENNTNNNCSAGVEVRVSATPKMYWTDVGTDKIQRANLDGSSVEDLVTTGLIRTEELALDVAGGKMYWADVGTDKIQRANLDGSSVEDLITTGLTNPDGIALDVAGGKMYWTDVGTDKIQRANLDGSSVEDLITTGLTSPESISLDVAGGKMYWTDGDIDKIQRANLDGSSVEDLITTGLTSPESISLDVAGGKMYWTDVGTDKIQRANLDGSSVEDLVTTGLGDPRGIALDVGGGKMYWTDGDIDKIQRANLDGSSVEDLVTTGLRNPQGIALYFFLPDLIVETPSVSNSNPNTDQSFTLSATVRNQGTDASPSTTLRYYRSTDETISTDDTQVGTDAVSSLSAFSTSEQSIDLTAPSIPGTYYYGACVESVTGERNTNNNCSAGVQIVVAGPNRSPEFPSGTVTRSLDENSSSNVNVGPPVTATDPDNDSLTYSLSGTDAGSFTIVSSTGQINTKSDVTYDYESKTSYSVTVVASDGNGGSASKSVTITLNDVNEPPSSAPSNVSVTPGDGQLTVTWDAISNESGKPPVSGYHVERRTGTSGSWGNRQTVSGTSATLSGLTNGQEYQVRVRTVNDEGESDWSSEVSGTPQSSNRPPEFSSDTVTRSVNENSSSNVNVGPPVTATDPDNDSLTYSLSGTDAGSFTIVSSSGQIRTKSGVTYDYESQSTYSVTVGASDDNGSSTSKSVTITLNDVNEPPSSVPSNVSVTPGDGQLTVTWDAVSNESGKPSVSGYDVERRTGTSGSWGNRQTVNGRTSTSKILTGLTNGQEYYVQVRTVNAEGESSWSSEVSGTPQSPNRDPEFSSGTVTRSVNENSSANVNVGSPVTATDPDNDTLTYSLSGTDAESFTIVSSSGQILTKSGVTYDYESKSTYSVTVDASDDNGGSASKSVTITLNDVNEPPSSAPSNVSVTPGDSQLTVTWDAVSNESGKPSVSGYHVERRTGTSGSWGNRQTVSGTSATLSGLTNDQEYQVRVRTVNAEGESGWSSEVSGTPQSPNRPPEFPSGTVTRSVNENSSANQNVGSPVTATDPDNDTLTYSLSGTDAGSFTIVSSSGQIHTKLGVTYDYESQSTYSVTVGASDDNGGSASKSVTININDVNEPPSSFPSGTVTRSVNENSSANQNVGTPVTTTDPDGDTLTYSLSGTDAGSFTIVSSSGQIRTKSGVTYDYESQSTYSVTVGASDDNGGSASKSVTITLNDVNEPPSSAPSNVGVTPGDSQLTVTWDAVSNESGKPSVSGYHVERRTGTSGSWGNRQTVSGRTSTSKTLTGLSNGQVYQVRVRTVNAEGESGWSTEVSGTPMPAPSGLTVTDITQTSARASWTAPSDISLINDYEVRVYQGTTQVGSTAYTASTSRNFGGLTAGTSYQMRVRARNTAPNPNTFSAQITQDFTTQVATATPDIVPNAFNFPNTTSNGKALARTIDQTISGLTSTTNGSITVSVAGTTIEEINVAKYGVVGVDGVSTTSPVTFTVDNGDVLGFDVFVPLTDKNVAWGVEVRINIGGVTDTWSHRNRP